MVWAADTNLLARLLVADDPAQHRAVVTRIESVSARGEAVLVGVVALVELSWVLATSYGKARSDIAAALALLVHTPPFVTLDRDAVQKALDRYRRGPGELSDYLLIETARAAGAAKVLTFDRRLLRHAECERP